MLEVAESCSVTAVLISAVDVLGKFVKLAPLPAKLVAVNTPHSVI